MKAVVVMARGGDTPPGRVLASSCFAGTLLRMTDAVRLVSAGIVDERLVEEGAAVAPMRTNHRRHSHAHQVLWSKMCSKYSNNLALHW